MTDVRETSVKTNGVELHVLEAGEGTPVVLMRNAFGDAFFYIVYFQEPGVADAELGKDPTRTMSRLLAGVKMSEGQTPDPAAFVNDGRGFVDRMPEFTGLPSWLTQDEL